MNTITITETPCTQCGRPESCDNGLCLTCIEKRITRRKIESKREIKKEYLKCVLSHNELLEYGNGLARLHAEANELKEQAKSVASDFKAKIDAAGSEAGIFARAIQNGFEYRDVECEVDRDFETKKVYTTRLDTGEIIKSRDMTQEEMQGRLFEAEKAA